MSGDRTHPPSARRLAEARRAGRVAWSPALVAGGAIAGGAIAIAAIGRAWLDEAGAGIVRGVDAASAESPVEEVTNVHGGAVLGDVLALAAPVVLVIAAVAVVAHVAQTRSGWLPRRSSRRLPASADGAARRTGLAALGVARGAVVAVVAAALLVPAAAVLAAAGPAEVGALGGQLAITLLAVAAAAAVALGLVDWLERARQLRADLAMSAREVRDERREAEADPTWRRERARHAKDPDDDAVRAAVAVMVAGDRAAAISWHPRWQPVPRVTAAHAGRGGLRLAALARRHRIAILHDPALAPALVALGAGGVIPERLHPALARVVVAVT